MDEYVYRPKISVVIPAYNASNYLAEAVDSVLAQTYPNIEIIVVNDGSEDDGATERVALSYGDKIKYFYKENGGSSTALNFGIKNMTGEWFSWLSHDDLYVPEKIQCQVDYISSMKIATNELPKNIFFSASELIDSNGTLIRCCNVKKAKRFSNKILRFQHNGYLIAEPTIYNFYGCSCLIHREAFDDVGGFDEKLRLINDLDLWFRFYAADYRVHYIPIPLVKGRIHSKQVSKSIGFSYHNPEQDMFWKRSLEWLINNHPNEEELFFRFGRNAFLKTRNDDGDRAFEQIKNSKIKKCMAKVVYRSRAKVHNFMKSLYLKFKT